MIRASSEMNSQTVSAAKAEPSPSTVPPQVQRFSIRVPKNNKKKYNVMRFNAGLKVDFQEWKQVKMQRENNVKDFKGVEEEMPKFGAGSEFGREAREEARRKKFGIRSRKYKSEDQPWILKPHGKTGKKFKGIKEGGVGENAAYYIFSQSSDGTIEAFPLHEWYNFQCIQRYKTLSAEEAEEEFSKRNKVLNYFSLMMRKRLRNEENADDADLIDGEKGKRSNKKKEKDLKISEMDEWIESEEDDDSDSDDKENQNKSDNEDDDNKKKKKAKDIKKKKKKNASDDEAFEESDDGDEEGRECEYISDSSASESELEQEKEIKSVAEESGLRELLASDEEDEDQEDKDNKSDNDKNGNEEGKEKDHKDEKNVKKSVDKKNAKKKSKKIGGSDSSSDFESGPEQNKDKNTQSSRSGILVSTSTDPSDSRKRTLSNSSDKLPAKKFKLESSYSSSSYSFGSSESKITEDAVRRYLMRKPMTTTELLQKFKAKKTGLSSEKIVIIMTNILKNINPTSQKIKGKMYFSIKPSN